MLALLLAKLAVGVNVLRLTVPRPVSALNVPPVTVTSDNVKLLPGFSVKVKSMTLVSFVFKLALEDVMTTLGAVVSTKYLPLLATAVEVMVALMPLASWSVEPFKLSALLAMATPLLSFCPAVTVVINVKALLPEPET